MVRFTQKKFVTQLCFPPSAKNLKNSTWKKKTCNKFMYKNSTHHPSLIFPFLLCIAYSCQYPFKQYD